jgi:hypothetical protein
MPSKAHTLLLISISCWQGWAFCFATAGSASADSPKRPPLELYHHIARAQLLADKADSQLLEKMQRVADRFKSDRLRFGSFPEDGQENKNLVEKLEDLAGANPYFGFPENTAADDPTFAAEHAQPGCDKEHVCVRILADASLSTSRIAASRKPPPQRWQAMPGTITIIHNTENLFALWGAGIDGKPIRDKTSGECSIISAEF